MAPRQFFYPRVVIDFYQTMTSRGECHLTAIHFTIDGCQGILRVADITVAFYLPVVLANSADNRQWPHSSPREMVRILSRDTSVCPILFRRQLPTGMLFVDHVLQSNMFPLQHVVQRQGAILEALYCIYEGLWFSPPGAYYDTPLPLRGEKYTKSTSAEPRPFHCCFQGCSVMY